MNRTFKTAPLDAAELAVCVFGAAFIFVAVEIGKWMVRKGWLYREDATTKPVSAPI